MVFAMPKVSSDLERRGEEGGTVVSHSSQPAADGTPHRRIVLVAWPQFGVAVVLDIETGDTCLPRLNSLLRIWRRRWNLFPKTSISQRLAAHEWDE